MGVHIVTTMFPKHRIIKLNKEGAKNFEKFAKKYGYKSADYLWNHKLNQKINKKRKNHNKLEAGDMVYLPLTPKEISVLQKFLKDTDKTIKLFDSLFNIYDKYYDEKKLNSKNLEICISILKKHMVDERKRVSKLKDDANKGKDRADWVQRIGFGIKNIVKIAQKTKKELGKQISKGTGTSALPKKPALAKAIENNPLLQGVGIMLNIEAHGARFAYLSTTDEAQVNKQGGYIRVAVEAWSNAFSLAHWTRVLMLTSDEDIDWTEAWSMSFEDLMDKRLNSFERDTALAINNLQKAKAEIDKAVNGWKKERTFQKDVHFDIKEQASVASFLLLNYS
jgi:hypothetical protein